MCARTSSTWTSASSGTTRGTIPCSRRWSSRSGEKGKKKLSAKIFFADNKESTKFSFSTPIKYRIFCYFYLGVECKSGWWSGNVAKTVAGVAGPGLFGRSGSRCEGPAPASPEINRRNCELNSLLLFPHWNFFYGWQTTILFIRAGAGSRRKKYPEPFRNRPAPQHRVRGLYITSPPPG